MNNHFILILRTKPFQIPTNFSFLDDINPTISNELKTKSQYTIHSNVRSKVLKSFINYLVNKILPSISIDNIHEYDLLSQEFSIMKNLIKLIKKQISKKGFSPFLSQNIDLQKELLAKKSESDQLSKKYQQIIYFLFNNYGFHDYENYLKYQSRLINECYRQDSDFVDFLTRRKVEKDGLIFIINENQKTASLLFNFSDKKDILIPKSVFFESDEFLVTEIAEGAFKYDEFITSVCFEEDSELRTIGKEAFIGCTSLESITIPDTVTRIEEFSFDNCVNLIKFELSEKSELKFIGKFALNKTLIGDLLIPSNVSELNFGFGRSMRNLKKVRINDDNKNFIYYDDKFILGKTLPTSENYDVLLFSRYGIEDIEIPSFIKVISSCSFFESNVKKINFTDDSELVLFGESSFFLSSLESIFIPQHVNEISNSCFYACSNLKAIEFSKKSELKTIGESSFANSNIKNIVLPPSVVEIAPFAFSYCQQIQSVEFVENSQLLTINPSIFYNSSIRSFTIPSSVVEIKDGWCNDTPNLTVIKIAEGNKNFIFYEDKFLLGKSSQSNDVYDILLFARRDIETANIPSHIKIISPYSFEKCQGLTNVSFSGDQEIVSIGKYAFSNSSIKSISIPPEVTAIESFTFSGCGKVEEVFFSKQSKLQIIKKEAFSDSFLQSISIPDCVTKIEESAFSHCINLRSIEITNNSNLRTIGKNAFSFTSLGSFTIPKHVRHISTSFHNCLQLTRIEFHDESELASIDCLGSIGLLSLSIPRTVTQLKEGWCSGMDNLIQIEVDPKNTNFIYYENAFLLGKTSPINRNYDSLLFARRNIKTAIIPKFVKRISADAFSECSNLKLVLFSDQSELKTIGNSAFSNTAIEFISIPQRVIQIEKFAFYDCEKLKKIKFSENSILRSFDDYAFCNSLLESIVIPSSVSHIGDFVFSNCNQLKIVEISENTRLLSISDCVFHRVTNVVIMMPTKIFKSAMNLTCEPMIMKKTV